MRILLDESLPRPLGRHLSGHTVRTVGQSGWTSFKNGVLMQLAASEFNVLITADQNLEHQQDLNALPIAVIVIVAASNRLESLEPLIPQVLAALDVLEPNKLLRVGASPTDR